MIESTDAKTQIRDFITDNFMMGRDPNELTDQVSLLELGIMDSTGVLELVGFLEQEFGITVEDSELVPENLDSVENMTRFVGQKTS